MYRYFAYSTALVSRTTVHELGRRVIDLLRFDQDPDLAAGLDRVGLLDSLERVCDLLQLLQPLDVSLQRFAASARAGRRDGVCGDEQQRLHCLWLLVVVMSSHCMHDRGGHPVPLQQVCADHRMRALDLVVDGLADVVQQP